jgi:thiamine biosynthesis protein ThiS
MSCSLRVNGDPLTLEGPDTVAQLVRRVTGREERQGLAVARNGEIVPRSRWDEVRVCDGDDIEIAAPFQGG